jgi:hypothetical protein
MKWLAVALLVACKGHEPAPAPAPAPGSGSAPVAERPSAFPASVAPPSELADLRQGMSFDMAARIAPKIVTSENVDTTIAGIKTHIKFSHSELDRIELEVPADTEETLTRLWGPSKWWLDPATGWFASYDRGTSMLSFTNQLPDPAQMTKDASSLDDSLRQLADARRSSGTRIEIFDPILSNRAALSSWLAVLAQRWGAPKPTSPGHWTYAAPVKVDAYISDLGELDIKLAPPSS